MTPAGNDCNLAWEKLSRYHALQCQFGDHIQAASVTPATGIHEHLEYLVHKKFLLLRVHAGLLDFRRLDTGLTI